ncbi:unnamed protein product [Callosobruchus maculatus]|uniref:Uncharacterized protein n=1 Tax=Callosobruchus maculatus TaxID=64391 RepID=A0A653DNA5_CALMS|nr:unnamed protein product [Callosobruchus maculatus]
MRRDASNAATLHHNASRCFPSDAAVDVPLLLLLRTPSNTLPSGEPSGRTIFWFRFRGPHGKRVPEPHQS